MDRFKIRDIAVLELNWVDGVLLVLKEGDHLLRRFGQVRIQKLRAGETRDEEVNDMEDEIWSLTSGTGILRIVDQRKGSPSLNEVVEIDMNEKNLITILVPFGLTFSFIAEKDSEIIQIRTHQEKI